MTDRLLDSLGWFIVVLFTVVIVVTAYRVFL